MPKIDVYSKEKGFCPRCKMTKMWLKQHGHKFNEHNVEQPKNRKLALGHGYASAPVTVVNGNWKHAVSGFDPMKLSNAIKSARSHVATHSFSSNMTSGRSISAVGTNPSESKHQNLGTDHNAKRSATIRKVASVRGMQR